MSWTSTLNYVNGYDSRDTSPIIYEKYLQIIIKRGSKNFLEVAKRIERLQ